jgi:hypothetical protein
LASVDATDKRRRGDRNTAHRESEAALNAIAAAEAKTAKLADRLERMEKAYGVLRSLLHEGELVHEKDLPALPAPR